ncbi:hypothetical protein HB807_09475 [Listeria welshimeri]|nr:hypothetical protein [Listeria welshimeri]MBC6140997.1 hypothetical protein [Listeria welshimeri]
MMGTIIDIVHEIDKSREKSIYKEDIILSEIPDSFGIILIFADSKSKLSFEVSKSTDNGVDLFLLQQYVENQSNDVLYFKPVKKLKTEIRKFKNKPRKTLSKPEIIFSQISNRSKLKFGYIEITEEQYNNGRIMEQFSKVCPEKPVMNSQFKSNDATPSWNGFNFQGFVTVLRTLEYMNSLPKKEYGNYSVEIEKYEDFIIYKNDIAQELFQVKAYVTEKSISAYNEACEKLINHKGQVGSSTATCFLATAAEITDWNESEFVDKISLYGYKEGMFIRTADIINCIKREIVVFFEDIEGNQDLLEVDMAFACISRVIIDKIDYLHRHRNARDEEYRINFSDIDNILRNVVKETHDHKLFFAKLAIDEKVLTNLDSELSDYCGDCEKDSCEFCPLNDLRESFESINRETYAKILDPTITIDDTNVYVAEVFSGFRIKDMLEVFEIMSLDIFFCDNQHIYILNESGLDHYLEKIVPSSIRITKGSGLSKVLKGIQKDTEIQRIYDRSAVTAEMPDKIIEYKNQKIHVIPESILGKKVENENMSISPEFNFNLINKKIFMKRSLENE